MLKRLFICMEAGWC